MHHKAFSVGKNNRASKHTPNWKSVTANIHQTMVPLLLYNQCKACQKCFWEHFALYMMASGISSENSIVTASVVIASDVCKIQNNYVIWECLMSSVLIKSCVMGLTAQTEAPQGHHSHFSATERWLQNCWHNCSSLMAESKQSWVRVSHSASQAIQESCKQWHNRCAGLHQVSQHIEGNTNNSVAFTVLRLTWRKHALLFLELQNVLLNKKRDYGAEPVVPSALPHKHHSLDNFLCWTDLRIVRNQTCLMWRKKRTGQGQLLEKRRPAITTEPPLQGNHSLRRSQHFCFKSRSKNSWRSWVIWLVFSGDNSESSM